MLDNKYNEHESNKLKNIGTTVENELCLEKLTDKKRGFFDEDQDAARFAASLAISKKLYLKEKINEPKPKTSTKWNFGAFDADGFFVDLITALDIYPENARAGLQSLVVMGLNYIYEIIKERDSFSIGDLIE